MSAREPKQHERVGSSADSPSSASTAGRRLAAHEDRLRLLLLHLAGRAVRERIESEDLVQEVFLRALADPTAWPERAPGDERDAALYRFLAHIARNAVVDAARSIRAWKRDGRTERLLHSDWSRTSGVRASDVRGAAPGPATRAAGSETQGALARAFLALAPDHRRVIGLRHFEGLSAAETARRMGRSEVAVHSLYRRALEAWEQESRSVG